MSTKYFALPLYAAAACVLMVAGAGSAFAGITQEVGDSGAYSLGIGLRASYDAVEDAADSGADYSNEFNLGSIRIYGGGQLNDHIKFEGNLDGSDADGGNIEVLDAVVKFELSENCNIWAGRFLPPSDRSNLSGPYFLNAWTYPIAALGYPAIYAGRDNGVAMFGQKGGGAFKWQFGAFEGTQGGSNTEDKPVFSGRLTWNLWEPEPGYYNSSTYYGAKDVLAIGLVGMSQDNGAGTASDPGDFTGWNVDVLMEKTVADGGVLSLEGAYYDYDRDGKGGVEGNGSFLLASYLMPNEVGTLGGRIQTMARFQEFESRELTEVGLNYVIDGHNSRISLVVGDDEPASGGSSTQSVRLGIQIQI